MDEWVKVRGTIVGSCGFDFRTLMPLLVEIWLFYQLFLQNENKLLKSKKSFLNWYLFRYTSAIVRSSSISQKFAKKPVEIACRSTDSSGMIWYNINKSRLLHTHRTTYRDHRLNPRYTEILIQQIQKHILKDTLWNCGSSSLEIFAPFFKIPSTFQQPTVK